MKNHFENPQQIAYLKANEGYSFLVLGSGKKILLSKPIKHHAAKFELEGWVRIHRSFLVNPIFIKQISEERDSIYLLDGIKLPIARRKLKLVTKWRDSTLFN